MFTTMIQAALLAVAIGTPAPVAASVPALCACPGCGPICCCDRCDGSCCEVVCPCPECCCSCCCASCEVCIAE